MNNNNHQDTNNIPLGESPDNLIHSQDNNNTSNNGKIEDDQKLNQRNIYTQNELNNTIYNHQKRINDGYSQYLLLNKQFDVIKETYTIGGNISLKVKDFIKMACDLLNDMFDLTYTVNVTEHFSLIKMLLNKAGNETNGDNCLIQLNAVINHISEIRQCIEYDPIKEYQINVQINDSIKDEYTLQQLNNIQDNNLIGFIRDMLEFRYNDRLSVEDNKEILIDLFQQFCIKWKQNLRIDSSKYEIGRFKIYLTCSFNKRDNSNKCNQYFGFEFDCVSSRLIKSRTPDRFTHTNHLIGEGMDDKKSRKITSKQRDFLREEMKYKSFAKIREENSWCKLNDQEMRDIRKKLLLERVYKDEELLKTSIEKNGPFLRITNKVKENVNKIHSVILINTEIASQIYSKHLWIADDTANINKAHKNLHLITTKDYFRETQIICAAILYDLRSSSYSFYFNQLKSILGYTPDTILVDRSTSQCSAIIDVFGDIVQYCLVHIGRNLHDTFKDGIICELFNETIYGKMPDFQFIEILEEIFENNGGFILAEKEEDESTVEIKPDKSDEEEKERGESIQNYINEEENKREEDEDVCGLKNNYERIELSENQIKQIEECTFEKGLKCIQGLLEQKDRWMPSETVYNGNYSERTTNRTEGQFGVLKKKINWEKLTISELLVEIKSISKSLMYRNHNYIQLNELIPIDPSIDVNRLSYSLKMILNEQIKLAIDPTKGSDRNHCRSCILRNYKNNEMKMSYPCYHLLRDKINTNSVITIDEIPYWCIITQLPLKLEKAKSELFSIEMNPNKEEDLNEIEKLKKVNNNLKENKEMKNIFEKKMEIELNSKTPISYISQVLPPAAKSTNNVNHKVRHFKPMKNEVIIEEEDRKGIKRRNPRNDIYKKHRFEDEDDDEIIKLNINWNEENVNFNNNNQNDKKLEKEDKNENEYDFLEGKKTIEINQEFIQGERKNNEEEEKKKKRSIEKKINVPKLNDNEINGIIKQYKEKTTIKILDLNFISNMKKEDFDDYTFTQEDKYIIIPIHYSGKKQYSCLIHIKPKIFWFFNCEEKEPNFSSFYSIVGYINNHSIGSEKIENSTYYTIKSWKFKQINATSYFTLYVINIFLKYVSEGIFDDKLKEKIEQELEQIELQKMINTIVGYIPR